MKVLISLRSSFFLKTVVLLLPSACCLAAKEYHSTITFQLHSVRLLHKLSFPFFSVLLGLQLTLFLELLFMSTSSSLRNCFICWSANSSPISMVTCSSCTSGISRSFKWSHLGKSFALITVGNSAIMNSSVVRNLGSYIDDKLSMNSHINKVCNASFYYLQNIRRIRKHLSRDSSETLIHAFFSSRLDYCNSLLYGLPQVQIDKIQRVQNAAARLIFQQPKFCHITPVLSQLHWLPIKYRIEFKILLMTFKATHGMAPDYICKLISPRKSRGYSLRSSQKSYAWGSRRQDTPNTWW